MPLNSHRQVRGPALRVFLSLLGVCQALQAVGGDNYWSGGFGDSWNATFNWHFVGPVVPQPRVPTDIDVAILETPNSDQVNLYADTAPINGLQIYNNIDLFTNGYLLNVDDDGAAETLISGNGSFLIVRDLLDIELDFLTDNLRIVSAGSLRLDGDADVRVEGATEISNGRFFDTSGLSAKVVFQGDVSVSNGGLLGALPQTPSNITDFTFAPGTTISSTSSGVVRLNYADNLVRISDGQQWLIDGGVLATRNDVQIAAASLLVTSGGSLDLVDDATVTLLAEGEASFQFPLLLDESKTFNLEGGLLTAETISFADSGALNFLGGNLSTRNYNASLVNVGGTLQPGIATGDTTIAGNYTQQSGGKVHFEIGGLGMGADYDFLSVTGNAQLDGELHVSLAGGFTPSATDTFLVLDSANLTGFFDNAGNGGRLTTTDGAGSFLVHYGLASQFDPDQIVLTDFQATGADQDHDGDVDGADFLLIQRSDPSLISLWESQFGAQTIPQTSTRPIPEPASWLLALAGLFWVCRPPQRLLKLSS